MDPEWRCEVPELNMGIFQPATCQKTNMESENHPFEKENNLLPKQSFFFFRGGCKWSCTGGYIMIHPGKLTAGYPKWWALQKVNPFKYGFYVWFLGCTGQIMATSPRVKQGPCFRQLIGKPFPLISGKSRLVKYYELARIFKRWQLFDIHIFGEIIFFNYDLRHVYNY